MRNSIEIICLTEALAEETMDERIATVQVIIDNAVIIGNGVTYQYRNDPVFSRLSPQSTIPS